MIQAVTSKRWNLLPAIPPEIDQELKEIPPVLRQLLYNRKVNSLSSAQAYLFTSGSVHDPYLLGGMEAAVWRIFHAIDHGEKIAVYGDYDVDGVTSTALLVQVLRRYCPESQGRISAYIPNRFEEGYGLNEDAIRQLQSDGFQLAITVDCGVRSPREVAFARQVGIDVIISDHHEPYGQLPEAAAVICPKKPGDEYPDKNLAGVGLAFKIAEALLQVRPVPGTRVEEWLDLVAIGTVADVVPLVGENRALVSAGLKQLRSCLRPGLCSLARVAGVNLERMTARDIGFMIGPRLNAAGRLDSALKALDLLMAEDIQTAGLYAQKLDDQNRERQEMTRQMVGEAEKLMKDTPLEHLILAVDEKFNMGVVGLVASRLVETYYRPAIVGAKSERETRASCRSIPEFDITAALDEVSDLFVRHGGHARAAGFTILNDRLPDLGERINAIARRKLGDLLLQPVLDVDAQINLDELHPSLLKELDHLEPTGMDNPEATFAAFGVCVRKQRAIGNDQKHLKLEVSGSPNSIVFDAIAFQKGALAQTKLDRVDLLFAVERNCYNGRETMQLRVKDIKAS